MSDNETDVDRNPVSPVVTSPDASGQTDGSRPVTSPVLPGEIEDGIWRAVIYAMQLGTTAMTLTSKAGTAVLVFVPAETQVSTTTVETPPPAR
jgi:hypothetical protein